MRPLCVARDAGVTRGVEVDPAGQVRALRERGADVVVSDRVELLREVR